MTINGIDYRKPNVYLLQETGIGVPEIAARTCYASFDKSENDIVKDFPIVLESCELDPEDCNWEGYTRLLNNTDKSGLLHDLAWTHHHHSILEHTNLSFYIQGTSRGVLQEHARHRIQAISVRSTRYTMSEILNAYIVAQVKANDYMWFQNKMLELDIFVNSNLAYNKLQIDDIWNKLEFQRHQIGDEEMYRSIISKKLFDDFFKMGYDLDSCYAYLKSLKKRNVGDSFKHIVNDNWKVDMVVTFNLRSLKNYFQLRDSGAAYFQIQMLAQAMKKATPEKYLKLIDKNYKD